MFLAITREKAHLLSASFSGNHWENRAKKAQTHLLVSVGLSGNGGLDFAVKKKGSEKALRRGSGKGVSSRCLERPLGECDPSGVRPSKAPVATSTLRNNNPPIEHQHFPNKECSP